MRPQTFGSISFALFMLFGTASAGAQDAVCVNPTEVAGFKTCADIAKAEQEGKLVVYSTDVEQGQAKIMAAFNATFPKIKPSYVRALSASLYAKLQSERQARQYLAD